MHKKIIFVINDFIKINIMNHNALCILFKTK